MKNKHSGFSGSLGFVLAAAGSAVGVGNIWRFPYLCAKDGGGLFLLVYLVLVLTFGFTLLTTDVAIGRRTKQNALNAFGTLHKKWRFLGYLTFLVPTLIMTYYSVIGGWIAKYFAVYLVSDGTQAAQDGFFTSFITSQVSPIVFMLLFLALTAWVVYCGVEKGIEKYSRYIMPVLLLLVIGIAVFSLTLSHTDDSGVTRTGLQGLAFYLKPDFTGMTLRSFLNVVLDAMSQLFFSLSVSMGIMITYGSYVKDDVDLNKANGQIEIFDTLFAFFAGLMIIPSVIAFNGGDPSQVNSGPSLMFISLPMVFDSMKFGTVIGAVFFLLVLFAALTSSIALMETLASVIMDKFKLKRIPATLIIIAVCLVVGMLSCLGYGPWESVTIIGMQFLDFFDFISNSVLMPIVAVLTCVLIGHVVGTKVVADEVKSGAGSFHREKLHRVMIRWIAPVLLVAILASELASKIFGVFSI